MRCIKLTLAYDGTAYAGWQVQPGRTTVQGTLDAAIEKITGQPADSLASGRTDAGVHALGQVASFHTESPLAADVLRRALNAELPHDVAVLQVEEMPADFHPIRDVQRKRYRYVIHDGPVRDVFRRRYCWHYVHGRLDADAMQRAAATLVGTHDFSSFESTGAPRVDSIRTIFHLSVERGRGTVPIFLAGGHKNGTVPFDLAGIGQGGAGGADLVVVEIEADGFLYNMVRALVGTLVEVGRAARPEDWPAAVLQATDRRLAGPTAPPQGLLLVQVTY